jgi:hypothetical protein
MNNNLDKFIKIEAVEETIVASLIRRTPSMTARRHPMTKHKVL